MILFYKKIRKKVFVLFIVLIMMFNMVTSEYKKVEAFAIAVPFIAVFMVAVSTVCVSSGVDIKIDDWPKLVSGLGQAMYYGEVGGNEAKNWFISVAEKTTLSTGVTLLQTLQDGKKLSELDLWSYMVPIGTAIQLTNTIKNAISRYICQEKGLTELKVGTYSNRAQAVQGVFAKYGFGIEYMNKNFYDYKYMYIMLNVLSNSPDTEPMKIYASNNPFTICQYINGSQSYWQMSGTDCYTQWLSGTIIPKGSGGKDEFNYWDFVDTAPLGSVMMTSYLTGSCLEKLVYCSFNSIIKNTVTGVTYTMVGNEIQQVVAPTNIDILTGSAIDELVVTNGLAKSMEDVTAASVKTVASTDEVMDKTKDEIIPATVGLDTSLARLKQMTGQQNSEFNNAWDKLDLKFNLPAYIINALSFVGYCFTAIWNGHGNYITVSVFSVTMGLIALIIGRGFIRNSSDVKGSDEE